MLSRPQNQQAPSGMPSSQMHLVPDSGPYLLANESQKICRWRLKKLARFRLISINKPHAHLAHRQEPSSLIVKAQDIIIVLHKAQLAAQERTSHMRITTSNHGSRLCSRSGPAGRPDLSLRPAQWPGQWAGLQWHRPVQSPAGNAGTLWGSCPVCERGLAAGQVRGALCSRLLVQAPSQPTSPVQHVHPSAPAPPLHRAQPAEPHLSMSTAARQCKTLEAVPGCGRTHLNDVGSAVIARLAPACGQQAKHKRVGDACDVAAGVVLHPV